MKMPIDEWYAVRTYICYITQETCDFGGRCSKCEFAGTQYEQELLADKELRDLEKSGGKPCV